MDTAHSDQQREASDPDTKATATPNTMSNTTPATADIVVIGDGQLARMMQTEAIEMGVRLRVLAGARDSSAAQVCGDVVVGDYTNLDDLRRAVDGAAVMTFDHEHVPNEHQRTLLAEGTEVQPRPEALLYAQDKLCQRERLTELGIPVPDFMRIDSAADAESFWDRTDGHVCLKARRGGYDGKGVWFPDSLDELTSLVDQQMAQGVELMTERAIALRRELSALVARSSSGEVVPWPVVETVQVDGVCYEAIAPAENLDASTAKTLQDLACTVARELGVVGVLAVELFEDENGEITVNELAMRPHNTGHWTQDGCVTSQFEQHLLAVSDVPLGSAALTAPHTVMVNTLGARDEVAMPLAERIREVRKRYPEVKIHLYGKEYRAGRKLGHVNLAGDRSVSELREDAEQAAHMLVHGQWRAYGLTIDNPPVGDLLIRPAAIPVGPAHRR